MSGAGFSWSTTKLRCSVCCSVFWPVWDMRWIPPAARKRLSNFCCRSGALRLRSDRSASFPAWAEKNCWNGCARCGPGCPPWSAADTRTSLTPPPPVSCKSRTCRRCWEALERELRNAAWKAAKGSFTVPQGLVVTATAQTRRGAHARRTGRHLRSLVNGIAAAECAAKDENCCSRWLWPQEGHSTSSAPGRRTSFSNLVPQSSHRYSKIGIMSLRKS